MVWLIVGVLSIMMLIALACVSIAGKADDIADYQCKQLKTTKLVNEDEDV